MNNGNRRVRPFAMWMVLAANMAVACAAGAQDPAFDPEAWIAEQVDRSDTLSIAAARLSGGETRYFNTGPVHPDRDAEVDSDTRFQIGSLTKAFTHMLLAEMVAAGDVRYDSTIDDLVGGQVSFANPAVGRITLLELATHTSGLPRLPANLSIDDPANPYADYGDKLLLAGIESARELQPLGDHYAYSNFGAGLLGYLLGVVDGEGYQRALDRRILEPLGLRQTEFDPSDHRAAGFSNGSVVADWTFGAVAGAGALWSTTSELMQMAQILLGQRDDPLSYHLDADREVIEPDADGFALTRVWHVAESPPGPVYWHNGGTGGFGSFFGFRPATGEAVALLVSGRADATGAGMRWFNAGPGETTPVDIDPGMTGQYEFEDGSGIGVFERDGRIMAQLAGQAPQPLTPIGDNWYAQDVFDISVRFLREADGAAVLELVQQGRVQRAERVADTAEAAARKEVSIDPEALAEYAGEYALAPGARFTIRLRGDRLRAQLTGQPFLPIFFKGEDVFFYKAVDAELHFERDDDGRIDALVLHQGGLRQRAERVD